MHTTDDDVPLVWRAEQHISKWSSARAVQTGRHSTSGHKTRSVLKVSLNGYPFSVIGTRASYLIREEPARTDLRVKC